MDRAVPSVCLVLVLLTVLRVCVYLLVVLVLESCGCVGSEKTYW